MAAASTLGEAEKQRRWLIPVIVGVVALLIGTGLGVSAAGGPPPTKTVTAAAKPAGTVTATETENVTATVTATPPAPTATVTTTFTPTPAIAMSDGQFAIPAELQPGRYHTDGTGSCYWETSKDLSGSFDAIIANGNTSGPTTIDIPSSAGGFSSSGGCAWSKVG